jgi:amino-acid N-acetyltransferase
MPVTIRPALKKDRFAIRILILRACLNPFNLHWRRFVVAEFEEKIIGVRQIKIHRDGSREVASGFVLPRYRKQGVSRRLMAALLEGQKSPLFLMCDEKWSGYYEQFGFQEEPSHRLPCCFFREYRVMKAFFELASRLVLGEKLRVISMKRTP